MELKSWHDVEDRNCNIQFYMLLAQTLISLARICSMMPFLDPQGHKPVCKFISYEKITEDLCTSLNVFCPQSKCVIP
jgi:hypothetical protein